MFDLDGTLLDMDEKLFSEKYTGLIYSYFQELSKEDFFNAFWKALENMMRHDDPNSFTLDGFMYPFSDMTDIAPDELLTRFIEFYTNEFPKLKDLGKSNLATEVINAAKNKNIKVLLATNPVFPSIATEQRCSWAGLKFDQFIHVTHAENTTVCKPNPRYYLELIEMLDVSAENVLMVGNHYLFDMAAKAVGIKTWLIDKNIDGFEYKDKFTIDFQGSIKQLIDEINKL